MNTKLITTAVLSLLLVGGVGLTEAGQRRRGGGGGGSQGSAGRAVPRAGGPVAVRPGVSARPAYPYYYGRRYGSYGYYGYPYGYYPYGLSLGFGYGYPYSYGYGYPYGNPYGYGGYGYVAGGYAGGSYGGVRITDAPRDAAVYADGYYVGTVDDFDGTFQRLSLEAGAHQIEIRPQGGQPIAFDVNIRPGQTITYRAN